MAEKGCDDDHERDHASRPHERGCNLRLFET